MLNSLKKRFIAKEGRGAATRDPATTTVVIAAAAPRDQRDGAAAAHSPRDIHVANTASMSALPLAAIGPRGQPLRHNLASHSASHRQPALTTSEPVATLTDAVVVGAAAAAPAPAAAGGDKGGDGGASLYRRLEAASSVCRVQSPPFIRRAAGTLLSSTFLGRGLSCVPTARNSGFICTVDGSWLAERQTEG